MSLLNSLTCSRVAPVSTLVFVVGRVFAFGVVGVLLPFGFGVVGFGFVVGGFFGCGFFGFFGANLDVADSDLRRSADREQRRNEHDRNDLRELLRRFYS